MNTNLERAKYGERLQKIPAEVQARMDRLGLTINKIAVQVPDIPRITVYRIMQRESDMTLAQAKQIAHVFKVSMERLYELFYESELGQNITAAGDEKLFQSGTVSLSTEGINSTDYLPSVREAA